MFVDGHRHGTKLRPLAHAVAQAIIHWDGQMWLLNIVGRHTNAKATTELLELYYSIIL